MSPRRPSPSARRTPAQAILAVISGTLLLAVRRRRRRADPAPAREAPRPALPPPRAPVGATAEPAAPSFSSRALPTYVPWAPPGRRVAIACALLALIAATVGVSILDAHGTSRLLLVLAAACLLPGASLMTRLPADDLLSALALAVALSLCVETVGALVMIWTGWWHPLGFSIVLAALCAALLVLDLHSSLHAMRETRR